MQFAPAVKHTIYLKNFLTYKLIPIVDDKLRLPDMIPSIIVFIKGTYFEDSITSVI